MSDSDAAPRAPLPIQTRVVPFTPNREVIFDLLTRAKRFHCPVSGTWEYDVAALSAARRAVRVDGRVLSLPACVVKATGLLLKKFPRLNHHLFHGLFGKYEVEFDQVRCTLVIMRRGRDGERLLFPLNIDRADELPIEDIQRTIDLHRWAPLDELPQVQALERLKRLPRLALTWASYRARSDHRFYLRYFGTYGVSCLNTRGWGPVAGHTVANTGSAFLVGPVRDLPQVKDGVVSTRPVLTLMLVADHYLVDGLDILEAMAYLRRLLSDPTRLGLPKVEVPDVVVAGEDDEA